MYYDEVQITMREFQSTLPVRGATLWTANNAILSVAISIHAPREGSDVRSNLTPSRPGGFQSTLPGRGATNLLVGFTPPSSGISIHAPREGSD